MPGVPALLIALARLAEACLLAGAGAFMVALAVSSGYWQYLNPRYSWLTLAAGACVLALAFAALADGRRRRRPTELAGLAVFLCLALASQTLPGMLAAPVASSSVQGGLTFSDDYGSAEAEEPVVSFAGREYVRINAAELIAGESGGWVREGGLFAVQGGVARTPELDRAGLVAVTRLFISCCFADAAGVVALVRVDDPEAFAPGTWVRVLGRMAPAPPLPDTEIAIYGALSAIRSDRFVLVAENVETPEFTGVPYLFEIRSEPPFAY